MGLGGKRPEIRASNLNSKVSSSGLQASQKCQLRLQESPQVLVNVVTLTEQGCRSHPGSSLSRYGDITFVGFLEGHVSLETSTRQVGWKAKVGLQPFLDFPGFKVSCTNIEEGICLEIHP